MKAVFDDDAIAEAHATAAYYEECRPALGEAFLNEVDAAKAEILQYPLAWGRIRGRFRRYRLHGFPYGLVYSLHEDTIYIAAVMHLSRKPGYWMRRRPEI